MALTPKQNDEIKCNVMGAFENALDLIDGYDRRPSRWEEDCLVRVLALMTCGQFAQAAVQLRDLLESSTSKVDPGRDVSRPARAWSLTTQRLREGLANLRALD